MVYYVRVYRHISEEPVEHKRRGSACEEARSSPGRENALSRPLALRAALPEATPSASVGASTGLGAPAAILAILAIPLWMALADAFIVA